jgi:hypothetical protein
MWLLSSMAERRPSKTEVGGSIPPAALNFYGEHAEKSAEKSTPVGTRTRDLRRVKATS